MVSRLEGAAVVPPPDASSVVDSGAAGQREVAENTGALSEDASTPALAAPKLAAPVAGSRGSLLVWLLGGTLGGVLLALGCFLALALWGAKKTTPRQLAQGPDAGTSKMAAGGNTAAPGKSGTVGLPGDQGATSKSSPASIPQPQSPQPTEPVVEKTTVEKTTKPNESQGGGEPKPNSTPRETLNETPVEPRPVRDAGTAAKPPVAVPPGQGLEPEGPPGLKPIQPDAKTAGPAPVAGRFANLLSGDLPAAGDVAGERGAADDERPDLPAGPLPGDRPGTTASVEEIVRPRLREVDVAARLADPITKMRLKDLPLADFASLMTDLSTAPVTLDLDALRVRWISVAAPVSVEVEQTTVRGVLTAALEPLQLGVGVGVGHVQVSHLVTPESARRRRTHDVADLVGTDPQQLEILAQWVQDLVEPESWVEAGGEGTIKGERSSLVIENRDSVHFQTLYLCDKLRAARKLPPRGRYAASLLAPASLPSRAESALRTPIPLNFSRATRLTQILNRLGQVANVRIVVDWQALQDAGWSPETMAKLNAEGRDLSEALRRLLEPRELTFRAVDDGTLEVTTPAAVARRLEWELYPLGEDFGDEGEARGVIERIQEAVGANHFRALGGSGSIRYVAASRSLLVALPDPQQRVAAKWLAEQRPQKASPQK